MYFLRALANRMARWKSRENEFVILFAFTFSTLIHCKSLLHLSGTQTTSDEGEEMLSDMSDQEGFYEPIPDFDYPSDDAVSDLQKSAIIHGRIVSSSEEAWNAISAKLRCGGDFMKLQLLGAGVDQVELCRGNSAPVPLGQLPPSCGHTSPTNGGLVYATPYDGCGVAQQGGNYVMQMLWQGNPAVISCPMTSSFANTSMSGFQPPRFLISHSRTPGSPVQSPLDTPDAATVSPPSIPSTDLPAMPLGYPPYHLYPPYYYHHYFKPPSQFSPTLAPAGKPDTAVTPASTLTQKPHSPFYPLMHWHSYYPGRVHATPGPPQQPTTQKPQPPGYPNMFWPYYYHHHHHGRPRPVPTSPPTTTSAVAHEPTQKPQLPVYPNMFWPYYYHHHHHHGRPRPVPTSPPTTTSAVAHEPTQKPQLPVYPNMYWPYYYHHHHGRPRPLPTSPPTTTSAVAHEPTQKPQLPVYPNMYWPYYYHHHHGRPRPVPTSPPTTTSAVAHEPTQKPQLPVYPHPFWPYYYPQYPMPPPKPQSPTAPPITTTPQPCTTTAAAECTPSANQLAVVPHKYSSVLYEKDPFALQYVDLLEYDPSLSHLFLNP